MLLSLDLIHANHLPQLNKPVASEGLGENVSELLAGVDKLDDDLPSINAIPEEMELDVDVFAPVMELRVIGKDDGRLVFHQQSRRLKLLPSELLQQPP